MKYVENSKITENVGTYMEKSLLKKAAIQSVTLMMTVIFISYALKHQQVITVMASSLFHSDFITAENEAMPKAAVITLNHEIQPVQAEEWMDPLTDVKSLKDKIDRNILNKLGDKFFAIRKPNGTGITLQLDDLYIRNRIQLNITGMASDELTEEMVYRIKDNDLFTGIPKYNETFSTEYDKEGNAELVAIRDYGKDFCHGITISGSQPNGKELYSTNIQIELDSVYAYIIYEDTGYYYIDLRKPKEIYEKVLVIDAGHGGKDVGAISKDGNYYEKDINLDIVLKLKELLDKENIKVYYTRTQEETVYLRPRVTLANVVDCDYFISIHCNSNLLDYPNGTEALYYDRTFKGVRSFDLATLFSEEIAKNVNLKNRGTVKKQSDDIYIIDQSVVPTVLIEVGYLSNKNDLNYLNQSDNRQAVARGIYQGIMRAYKELPISEE